MTRIRRATLSLCAIAAVGAATVALAADPTPEEKVARVAPAIVTVQMVLKIQISIGGQPMDQEQKGDRLGVLVDPSGLVMVGDVGHLVRRIEEGLPAGTSIRLTPTSLKISFASETKEYEAVLVARDMTLGLAFLQILDLDRPVPGSLDLSKGSEPRLGQSLWGVRRLPRAFDEAPELLRMRVRQVIEQPRKMWGIGGDFEDIGLPAFDAAGVPVGVVSYQVGAEGLDLQSLSGRGGADVRAFLLPMDAVRGSIERAKKLVAGVVEKAKAEKSAATEADKAGEKSPEEKGDGGKGDGKGAAEPGMGDAPPAPGSPPKEPSPPK